MDGHEYLTLVMHSVPTLCIMRGPFFCPQVICRVLDKDDKEDRHGAHASNNISVGENTIQIVDAQTVRLPVITVV